MIIMPQWIKNTWQGRPVVYMGDGKNSATFYGPDAERLRDEYFAALAPKAIDERQNRDFKGQAHEHR